MNKLAAAFVAVLALMPLAFAVDLGDYPTFLFEDHNLNAYVVVGADAKPADVVGAVDLAVRLAGESYEEKTITGGVSVTGAESEDVDLGALITSEVESILDDADLAGFKDSTITFDDGTGAEDYDFHEELILGQGTNGLYVQTSLTSDDDYETDVYLEIKPDNIRYCFEFDDSINISKADEDYPLEIEFLGDTLTIIGADADSITAEVGNKQTLYVGDTMTVGGKTIELKDVGSDGTIVVIVDGVQDYISEGYTKTVNGVKIYNKAGFYTDEKTDRWAIIVAGEEARETYDNGDPYIGEDEDNPTWVWYLANLNTNDPTICVEYDQTRDSLDDEPVGVGECYALPNDYAKVCLDSLTVADSDYATYTFEVKDGVDLSDVFSGETDEVVFRISTSDEEGLTYIGGSSTKSSNKVYLYMKASNNITILYVDTDSNDVMYAGDIEPGDSNVQVAKINYDDTQLDINVSTVYNSTKTQIDAILLKVEGLDANDAIYMNVSIDTSAKQIKALGDTAEQEESAELKWGSTSIGNKDVDLRTKYGIIIKDPESNGANDMVKLEVPADQVEAKIVVYGPESAVTTTEGETVKDVRPITTPVAKLDTEIADPATVGKDLILVGGPAVNRLTAQAMGYEYPTYGADITEISEGEGFIGYYPDVFATGQDVVVVFGWEAEQTRVACAALQQYTDFLDDFAGHTKVKVTGTITAPVITPIE